MKLWQLLEALKLGGKGSGHYGHAGVPGHRGGSLPRGVAVSLKTGRTAAFRQGIVRLVHELGGPDNQEAISVLTRVAETWRDSPEEHLRAEDLRGANGDIIQYGLAETMGFTKPMKHSSPQELDALVSTGDYEEIFRGVRAKGDVPGAQRVLQEEYFSGGGMLGSGIYVARGTGAKDLALYYGGDNPRNVARMLMPTNAKTITKQDMYVLEGKAKDIMVRGSAERFQRIMKDWDGGVAGYEKAILSIMLDTRAMDAAILHTVLSDHGRLGTLLGYDAILDNRGYVGLVLNRSILYAESK